MSATIDLLLKYGELNISFDGVSWYAYITGANMLSTMSGEDPHEDEAYEALLELVERKMYGFCILIEADKLNDN